MTGPGTCTWLDGRRYEGEWHLNNMEGIGTYFWADGRKYQGEYKEDKEHGYGICIWPDGSSHSGEWFAGQRHGLGVYRRHVDDVLEYGLWENGERIMVFSEEQIEQITKGEIDYKGFFTQLDSRDNVDLNSKPFAAPDNFHDRLNEVT